MRQREARSMWAAADTHHTPRHPFTHGRQTAQPANYARENAALSASSSQACGAPVDEADEVSDRHSTPATACGHERRASRHAPD